MGGQKLYLLARKGIEIERRPVQIEVKTTILDYSYPELKIQVSCSKGTYIRSIARDFGKILNSGAYLKELKRTSIGEYLLEDAWELDDFIEGVSNR